MDKSKRNEVLQALESAINTEKPDDLIQFCADFLDRRVEQNQNDRHNEWYVGLHMPNKPRQEFIDFVKSPVKFTVPKYNLNDHQNFEKKEHLDPPYHNVTRRTSVSAESLVPIDSDEKNGLFDIVHKTEAQLDLIEKSIHDNVLFRRLDREQMIEIQSAIKVHSVEMDEILFRQGDLAEYFYIVQEGTFHVYQKHDNQDESFGDLFTVFSKGDSFGELALMYNAPRAATIVCKSVKSVLLCLDRVTFQRIIMNTTFRRRNLLDTFVNRVPLLATIHSSQRRKIADTLKFLLIEQGTEIIKEGEPGDHFYIIESGKAEVKKEGFGVISTLSTGDHFGEFALIHNITRTATITAITDVKLATLSKNDFQILLGDVFTSTRFLIPGYASQEPQVPAESISGPNL